MSFIDEPITLLGDLFKKLGDDEAIIAEFPSGYKRYICKKSRLDKFDAAWPIDRPYKYDWVYKTYHVKLSTTKTTEKKDYHDNKIEIKPRNRCYIDPIAHTKELNEFDPISRTKNIREWYGLLYDKYFKIKRIICDGPATIIFWNDGTKTIVKAQDEFDYEKGILYAALKKLATKKEYDNILRAIDKVDETRKDDPIKSIRDNLFPDRTLSPDEAEEFTKSLKTRKHPSDQKCPYCGANWNMTIQRSKCLQKHGAISIVCGKCNGMFTVKFEDDKYVCRPFYKGGDK